ncbi:ABC transporter substrate-binding protein [Rhodohalobacter mucosus]|uniref:Solute-binding protein family 5 domain-containing protein n=1 Tax=Rhodohalobacter mucosus TaxID=2079485 RepID=A0A316TM03_9BACT|nr:ABC transporter substrate-binding protein [Rhodohalobacter mucosus]PWN05607.1 hypothetical protein DDZ15_13495 [Rhodohalobacter mucosus]
MITARQFLLSLIPILMLLQACGSSSEVVVVRDAPRTGSTDTTETAEDDTFTSLSIGLIEPVTNMDPLFAQDLSTMRVLSAVYQTLYTIDPEGDVQPLLADQTAVSPDSLEYTITLKEDVFYHDSEVFNAGVGRELHARDVKWAFERAARNNVPPHAAELLKNIRGFRSFFMEQREVFDPAKRVLEGVTGIEVQNARTLKISLREKDHEFTSKLASPLLSIYPSESILRPQQALSEKPVGTGPYSFRSADSTAIVLALNDPDNQRDEMINRIDFIHGRSEGQLFQEFARNRIDWIPEMGPQMMEQIILNGDLRESYADEYNLTMQPASRITSIYLNRESDFSLAELSDRIASFQEYRFSVEGTSYFNIEGLTVSGPDTSAAADSARYLVVHTDNPFARWLFAEINREWMNPEAGLAYLNIRVPIPEASFYSRMHDTFHDRYLPDPAKTPWLRFESPVYGIYHENVQIDDIPATPWALPIDSIQLNNR